MLMSTALGMKDRNGQPYAVSKVGAGRVQAYEAALTPLVFDPPSISFGIVPANTVNNGTRTIKVTNISDSAIHTSVAFSATDGLRLDGPTTLDVPAHGSVDLPVGYSIDVRNASVVETELEGRAVLSLAGAVPARPDAPALSLAVPALAVATRGSEVSVASAAPLSAGHVSLSISNRGPINGDVLAFNLLGRDEIGTPRAGACDMTASGYRIVHQGNKDFLQFGFSLASPLSTWNFCELSVLVDENGDGIAEQEIAGTFDSDLRPDSTTATSPFATFLVDAPKMRDIRARIEQGQAKPSDYPSSVIDEQPFVRYPLSTVAYISADLSKIKRTAAGKLRVKVGVLSATEGALVDDFLGQGNTGSWFEIDPNALPYKDIQESVSAATATSSTLDFTSAGLGRDVVVYLPQNTTAAGRSVLVSANGQALTIP
jgi:hypothetical protein